MSSQLLSPRLSVNYLVVLWLCCTLVNSALDADDDTQRRGREIGFIDLGECHCRGSLFLRNVSLQRAPTLISMQSVVRLARSEPHTKATAHRVSSQAMSPQSAMMPNVFH